MNIRLNYGLRMIPLFLYGILISYFIIINTFDFWTPMINIDSNLLNWFIAGFMNVFIVFFFLYLRLFVIKLSYQDLNEKIPHSNFWELIQFYFTVLFVILVIVNGLFLTFNYYNNEFFQIIQILLIFIPFIIDLVFHLKWIFI
jgi:hypothetical protein